MEKRDETGMKLRKIWLMALVVVMLCTHMAMALGEDCFVIDVDTLDMNSLNSDEYVALHLTASAQACGCASTSAIPPSWPYRCG